MEVAQVTADPLKIISLSRDLFFSFVPGPLSWVWRSPAAQATGPEPGSRHICKEPRYCLVGEKQSKQWMELKYEQQGRWGLEFIHATEIKGTGSTTRPVLAAGLLKWSIRVYVRGSWLDSGKFWAMNHKGAENRLLYVYLVRFKPSTVLVFVVIM